MAKIQYVVKPGESLSSIARDKLNDISRWDELAYINQIVTPYVIQPGQVILLPDDSQPLTVEIVKKVPEPAAAMKAGFSFSPATIVLLVVAAALLLSKEK